MNISGFIYMVLKSRDNVFKMSKKLPVVLYNTYTGTGTCIMFILKS